MSTFTQKYRPLQFKDVLDQENIIKILKNILKSKKLSSPFMFTGAFGGGKTTLARIFAKAILCKNLKDFEPCNECPSCKSFLEGSHLAYLEIDAASNSGVESIRKLREDANFKALGDYEKKVVVIDECQSISKQGNEALLKQLEDSNCNQIYIFCTTSPEDMHETVRSRCFEFQLNKNTKESISERLKEICQKEGISFEESGIDIISEICSPHVRDAIKNLEYLSNFGHISKENVFNYFNLFLDFDFLNILFNIKDNPAEAIKTINTIILKTSIQNIYEGLIKNLLNIVKLSYGINSFQNEGQLELGKKILENQGNGVLNILEYLLKRNKYVDILTIESDIFLLNSLITGTFKEPQQDNSSKIIPKEIKSTLEEKSTQNEISDEHTTQVLKRYKSYPPSLAMMMDKSKKSSTLIRTSTVELNVKDYKHNLPKRDIKNFIESKIKGKDG